MQLPPDWRVRVSPWTGAVVLQRRHESQVPYSIYPGPHYIWVDANSTDLTDFFRAPTPAPTKDNP